MLKRRNSVWFEEDVDDSGNHKNSKRAHLEDSSTLNNTNAINSVSATKVPAKIVERRESERLRRKRERTNANKNKSTDNATADDADNDDAKADIDMETIANDQSVDVVKAPKKSAYKLKPRSELTKAVLNQFGKPKLENETNKLSAICRICHESKHFLKGNISNLKTHLKRVFI